MNNVSDWIIEWFLKNTIANREELEKNMENSYFELGYLDSFEFIRFISDIEESFNIEFNNEQFEDRSFSTISGLIKIVENTIE